MPLRTITKYRVHIIFFWIFGLLGGILFSKHSEDILKRFAACDIYVKPSLLGLIISAVLPVFLAHFLLIKKQYKLLPFLLFLNAFVHGYAVWFYANVCHLGGSMFSSIFLISQNSSVSLILFICLQVWDERRGIIATTLASGSIVVINYLSGFLF